MKQDINKSNNAQSILNVVFDSNRDLNNKFLDKQHLTDIEQDIGVLPNVLPKTTSNTSQQSNRFQNFRVPLSFRSSIRQQSANFGKGYQKQGRQSLVADFNNDVLNWMLVSARCELCEKLPKQPKVSLCQCSHTFCQNCLKMYMIYKINSSQEIRCPQQSCDNIINPENHLFNELPEKLKERYQQQRLWRQTQQNPNLRLCPRENCKNGIVNLLATPPICNRCQKTFCKQCQLEAHQGPCQKKFQEIFTQWKRCPKCHIFIQKNQGCNHMTCNCGHQFCYVCLADWQNSHYQCGVVDPVQAWINEQVQLPMNFCIKILLGSVLIVFFPLLLVIYTTGMMVALFLGIIGGIFIVPIVFCGMISKSSTSSADGVQILCILSLVIGCLIGAAVAVYYYCIFLNPYIQKYCKRISLLCSCS